MRFAIHILVTVGVSVPVCVATNLLLDKLESRRD